MHEELECEQLLQESVYSKFKTKFHHWFDKSEEDELQVQLV